MSKSVLKYPLNVEIESKQKSQNKNFNIDDVIKAFSNYIDANISLNDVIKKN